MMKDVKAHDYPQWLVCDSCTSQQQAEWAALAAHGNKKGEMLYGVVNTQTSQLVWVTVALRERSARMSNLVP